MIEAGPKELSELHGELNSMLADIEKETSKQTPDMAELAAIRFKLTRASRRREAVVNEIVDLWGLTASDEFKNKLVSLRDDMQRARACSAAHIGKWTTRAVVSDWQGYQKDSRVIRAAMRKQIEKEALIFLRVS